jgi:hypothetical protein
LQISRREEGIAIFHLALLATCVVLLSRSQPGTANLDIRVGVVAYEEFQNELGYFEDLFAELSRQEPSVRFRLAVGSYGAAQLIQPTFALRPARPKMRRAISAAVFFPAPARSRLSFLLLLVIVLVSLSCSCSSLFRARARHRTRCS